MRYCQYYAIPITLVTQRGGVDSIQLLTRKGANCTELLSCLYGLKPMEVQVFYVLAGRGSATVDEVSASVGRDRTTVHRCLSKLVSAGLVYRQASSLKDGGYRYVYMPAEPSRIRVLAEERVREIATSLQSLVDNFERDLKARTGREGPQPAVR